MTIRKYKLVMKNGDILFKEGKVPEIFRSIDGKLLGCNESNCQNIKTCKEECVFYTVDHVDVEEVINVDINEAIKIKEDEIKENCKSKCTTCSHYVNFKVVGTQGQRLFCYSCIYGAYLPKVDRYFQNGPYDNI